MDEAELQARFITELIALERSGAVLPFHFRPSHAWYVLAGLQLALRHPEMQLGEAAKFLNSLARNIESRLCNSNRPAMTEVARMGWNPEHDVAAAERRTGGNPAVPPPSEPPEPEGEPEPAAAETAKRKPERTPDNKQLDAPENKALGKRKRK